MLYIVIGLTMLVLGTVFFGAPYVPTRKKDTDKAIDLLKPHDVFVDLGSGDGRLVRAAAAKGNRAYGIELSPIIAAISWFVIRPVHRRAKIIVGNYWHKQLPDDTTVVFVFLASSYMQKLRGHLEKEARRLKRPLRLISYGFELPGYEPIHQDKALLVYEILP